MVSAGKIFKLSKEIGLRQISKRLENYRKEEVFEQGDQKINLLKEIQIAVSVKKG
jgi:hypothetical protein